MSLNWPEYWAQRPRTATGDLDDLLAQVGKTQLGKPVEAAQVDVLVEHLAGTLALTSSDRALDLGCGNGLLTARLAPRVAEVVGLDYSAALLEDAATHSSAPNIGYRQADLRAASAISLPPGPWTAAWSVEVVQNLDPASLVELLRFLADAMSDDMRFLASGIPDQARIRSFYDTEERWSLHLENERNGREQMGRWWEKAELEDAAAQAGLSVRFVALPSSYYTAHYRTDALFTR